MHRTSRALLLAFAFEALIHLATPATGQGGIQTIYVLNLSHADVGFDAPPSVMDQRNHDRTVAALNLADAHPTFRWTIETAHQLDGFMQRASPANVGRLSARLAQGRLAFGANYTNLHSGLCGEEELHRLTLDAVRFGDLLGTHARTAFLNDVPGFTMAMPRVLATSGVPYAVLGPNGTFGGKPSIPLSDTAFWWEARDGSRVLTWITYGSYAEGFVEWGMTSLANANATIPGKLQEYQNAGYAFDAVLVVWAFDDIFPSSHMVNLAANWNATHTTPTLIPATAGEFFDHLLSTYGSGAFPTYTGDASGMWEDAATITPASCARVRRARAMLPDLEALSAATFATFGKRSPEKDLRDAWRNALLLDEHSGGGVGWPGILTQAEVEQQNREFVAIARACEEPARSVLKRTQAFLGPRMVPAGESGLVLCNPLGAAFDGVVEVDCGSAQPPDLRLQSPSGGPDAVFRWLDSGRTKLAVSATLPPRGWRRWKVTGGGSAPPPPTWSAADRIAIGGHELIVDNVDGTAVSLVDQGTGFDWLAQNTPHRFAGVEYGSNIVVFFGGSSPANPFPVSLEAEATAPLFRRLRVRAPNGDLIREYRLHDGEPHVDVDAWVHRSMLPYVPYAEHSYHFGMSFPANLDLPTELHIDGPDGWYRPGPESLPGSGLSHFGVSTGARLVGSNGRWLSISSVDSPLLDLGEMNGAAGAAIETQENSLTWKLIRHANEGQVANGQIVAFEAEPGLPDAIPYRFRVRFGHPTTPPPDRETLRRDLAPPFATWVAAGGAPAGLAASGTYLDIQGPATLTCFKRAEDDCGVILRLRAGPGGGTARITIPFPFQSAWLADLVERPIQSLTAVGGVMNVTLVANGVVTIRLND